MDRSIAIITYELKPDELECLVRRFAKYHHMMKSHQILTDSTVIGELSDLCKQIHNPPKLLLNPDGSLNCENMNNFISNLTFDGKTILQDYSDIIIAVNRKIIDEKSTEQHVKNRNGEAYGGSATGSTYMNGSYCFIGLRPLHLLNSSADRNKYVDYVVRHELGHMIGGLEHTPYDAEDDIMKPITYATETHLAKKSIDYTPRQFQQIKAALSKINIQSIKRHREKQNI